MNKQPDTMTPKGALAANAYLRADEPRKQMHNHCVAIVAELGKDNTYFDSKISIRLISCCKGDPKEQVEVKLHGLSDRIVFRSAAWGGMVHTYCQGQWVDYINELAGFATDAIEKRKTEAEAAAQQRFVPVDDDSIFRGELPN